MSGIIRGLTENGARIEVQNRFGTITLSRDEVDRIERKASVEDEFRERRAKLADDDVEGRFRLALWLRDEGWEARAREGRGTFRPDSRCEGLMRPWRLKSAASRICGAAWRISWRMGLAFV